MLLTLRDYDIDHPEPAAASDAVKWRKVQRHILAILHLNCEPKQARLFRSAQTRKQACDILARRYASSSTPNVMRLEESFGTARQGDNQTMTDWLAHLDNLAEELGSVGVEISDVRLANRLVGGLAPQYDSIKQALHARTDGSSLDAVREHLLSYELEASLPNKDPVPIPNSSATPLFHINRPYAHNHTHRGPMATAMLNTTAVPNTSSCPIHTHQPCLCPIPSPPHSASSTARLPSASYRFSPYPSLVCHACGNIGHTQNRC